MQNLNDNNFFLLFHAKFNIKVAYVLINYSHVIVRQINPIPALGINILKDLRKEPNKNHGYLQRVKSKMYQFL